MHFILIARRLPKPHRHSDHHHQSRRTFLDVATINWVRDRALDHAVEKERDLKPMLNLKNLIKSEPSKSLPLSLIAQNKDYLGIPTRPIDFLRKYPSVFEEFFPGGVGIHPHVKLTPEVLNLDVEEQVIFQTESHKQDIADRLLKLLMIGRINKIPIQIIDRLKWDLGLPQDYTKSLIPEFPDYFQVTNGIEPYLELVCWSNDLAVSAMEKKAISGEKGYEKSMPLAFPLQYSRGFEIEKKFKKWVDEWQKLPYISPYENALQLQPKSDESDKWAVSLLHELLSILIPKKTERDNLLCLGEYFGVRSRFKRAMLQHPGIFYISSKIGTHTVVLREAYKRDLLLGKHHPLMGLRSSYVHLMYTVKDEKKSKNLKGDGSRSLKTKSDLREGEGENSVEQDGKLSSNSDSEFEDASEDDYDDEEEEEDEEVAGEGNNTRSNRGKIARRTGYEVKRASISDKIGRRTTRDNGYDAKDDVEPDKTTIIGKRDRKVQFHEKTPQRTNSYSSGRIKFRNSSYDAKDDVEPDKTTIIGRRDRKVQFHEKTPQRTNSYSSGRSKFRNSSYDANGEVRNGNTGGTGRTRESTKTNFGEQIPLRMDQGLGRKGVVRDQKNSPSQSARERFRSTEMPASQSARERSKKRSGVSRTRGRANSSIQ